MIFILVNNNKALMSIIENNNKWDKSNIVFRNNEIISYKKRMMKKNENIDYGLSIFKKHHLKNFRKNENFDLSLLYEHLIE